MGYDMAKIINFECVSVMNIREVGQARSWESALRQLDKMPCNMVALTLGKQKYLIAWGMLNYIYKCLQKDRPVPVAVNGDVWYIEQYEDVEKLVFMLPTHRLFTGKNGVITYVGAIRQNTQDGVINQRLN